MKPGHPQPPILVPTLDGVSVPLAAIVWIVSDFDMAVDHQPVVVQLANGERLRVRADVLRRIFRIRRRQTA